MGLSSNFVRPSFATLTPYRDLKFPKMNIIPLVNKHYWGHCDKAKTISKILLVSLSDNLSTEEIWIFLKRYYEFLHVKGLQSCGLSNFEDDSIIQELNAGRPRVVRGRPSGKIFFQISNFDSLLLCSILTYRDLFGKI